MSEQWSNVTFANEGDWLVTIERTGSEFRWRVSSPGAFGSGRADAAPEALLNALFTLGGRTNDLAGPEWLLRR